MCNCSATDVKERGNCAPNCDCRPINTPFRVGDVCHYFGGCNTDLEFKVIMIHKDRVVFERLPDGHIISRMLDGTYQNAASIMPPKRTKTKVIMVAVEKLHPSIIRAMSIDFYHQWWERTESRDMYVWTRIEVEIPV